MTEVESECELEFEICLGMSNIAIGRGRKLECKFGEEWC